MSNTHGVFGFLLLGLPAGMLATHALSWELGTGVSLEGEARCNPGESTSDIVVSLRRPGMPLPPPAEPPAVLDQRKLRFVPHVLPVLVGTRVQFPNSDPIRHNVFSASEARMFNLGIYRTGVTRDVTFDKPGVIEVLCNVHPEMSAFIVVLDTPYFSSTNQESQFGISNLPPGGYQLSFWCEHRGELKREIQLDSVRSLRLRAILHSGLIDIEPAAANPGATRPGEPGDTLFPVRRVR